jgi:hypothetical protein
VFARLLALALLVHLAIGADPAVADLYNPVPAPGKSRLMAALVEKYASGDQALCFLGTEYVPRERRFRYVELEPSFFARFISGQIEHGRVNQVGCPTLEDPRSSCAGGCTTITVWVLDQAWSECEREGISFTQAYGKPTGRPMLFLQLFRTHFREKEFYMTEVAPCGYLIRDHRENPHFIE